MQEVAQCRRLHGARGCTVQEAAWRRRPHGAGGRKAQDGAGGRMVQETLGCMLSASHHLPLSVRPHKKKKVWASIIFEGPHQPHQNSFSPSETFRAN